MYQDKLFAMNESFFQASVFHLLQGSVDRKNSRYNSYFDVFDQTVLVGVE